MGAGHRLISLLLALCIMLLSSSAALAVSAAAALPGKNPEPRHLVCTALSEAAESYYTGEYSYDKLCALSGAEDVSTGLSAMSGNELFSALHELMTNTHTYQTSYAGYSPGSLAYYWTSTDAVDGSDTYVMFYSDIMADQDVKLNREHIWPKSRASYYQTNGGADLHHLRPAVDSLNQSKSDHAFGDILGTYSSGYTEGVINGATMYYVSAGKDLFECKDDVKGDVARILLYVYCRWEQPNLYTSMTEGLPEPDRDDDANSGKKAVESLDTLLRWCMLDPVDTWEMERNDLTQMIQGNRNVFIDYPELAWRMFGIELPVGMSTPTHIGCDHEYEEVSRIDAACAADGSFTMRCSRCGSEYTRRIAALGHADGDRDEHCDRCSKELTIPVDMTLSDALSDGDHVVIYHPSTKSAVSAEPDDKNGLKATAAYVSKDVLHPDEKALVFTARSAGDDLYRFVSGGTYLSAADGALGLSAEPDGESLWRVTPSGTGKQMFIDCANADSVRLRVNFGSFNTNSAKTTPAFRFELYTTNEHYPDSGEITKQPSPDEAGEITYTCLLCGGKHTEPLTDSVTIAGDTDGDLLVTVIDVTAVQRALAGFAVLRFNEKAADVTGEGVDIMDATAVQRYLVGFTDPYGIGRPIS